MAVVDRWWTEGVDGTRRTRTRSPEYGRGKRWEARWRDSAGHQCKARYEYKDDALDAIAKARLTPAARRAASTVRDLYEVWIATKARSRQPKTVADYRSAWRAHIEPELGDRIVATLSAVELAGWWTRITSADSARRVLVVMRGVLDLAVADQLIATNPLAATSGGQSRRREVQTLTDTQLAALADSLTGAGCGTEFWTLASCGLRFGEMAALTPRSAAKIGDVWALRITRSVQRIRGEVVYGPPKNGRPRDVPCPAWLAQQLAAVDGPLALPGPGGMPWLGDTWRPGWERARVAANLPGLHTHDLRHDYAARQIDAGVDLKTLQEVMGHARLSITTDLYGSMARSSLGRVADIHPHAGGSSPV